LTDFVIDAGPDPIATGESPEIILAAPQSLRIISEDWRIAANIATRDAIPPSQRKEGLHVYVVDTELVYVLGPGLGNGDWSVLPWEGQDIHIPSGHALYFDSRACIQSPEDANLLLSNSAGDSFGLLQFGGVTASYPAIRRNGTIMMLRLADDSGYCPVYSDTIIGNKNIFAGATYSFIWSGKSQMRSPSDGKIDLRNNDDTGWSDLEGRDLISNGEVSSPRAKWTEEGGRAIKLTNRTGAPSVKGQIVEASGSYDNAFQTAVATSYDPIGAVYESGIADGSDCWIVCGGRAQVLLEDSTAATRGYWVGTSTVTGGRADATSASSPGLALAHFRELGHCIESVPAGTNKLAFIMMHFL
jgi:hypothetical protein